VPIPGKFTRVRARGERSYTFLAGLERASAISDVCERYYSKKGRREFKLRRKERQSQSRQMRLALRHFSKPSRHNPRPSAVIFERRPDVKTYTNPQGNHKDWLMKWAQETDVSAVNLQSEEPRNNREARELLQRAAAALRERRALLSVPKERRLKSHKNPLLRHPVLQGDEECDLQAGLLSALKPALTVTNAAKAALTVSVGWTCRSIARLANGLHRDTHVVMTDARSMLKEMEQTIKKWCGELYLPILFTVSGFLFSKAGSGFGGILIRTAIVAFLARHTHLWDLVKYYFTFKPENSFRVQLQSFDYGCIGKIFTACTVGVLCRGGLNRRTLDGLGKTLSNLPRIAEGWAHLSEWLVQATEAVVNFVMRRGEEDKIHFSDKLSSKDPAVKEWTDQAYELLKFLQSAGADASAQKYAVQLHRWNIKGLELIQQYPEDSVSARVINNVRLTVSNALQPYMAQVHSTLGTRQEPVMVVFRGAAGVGKTFLLDYLVPAMMCHADPSLEGRDQKFWRTNMWCKPKDSPYWEGYTGQDVLIHDEIFQSDPSKTAPGENDYINIINQINVFCLNLNMATLQSKGLYCFNSRLVIGTTNIASIHSQASQCIAEVSAVYRRLHHTYELQWVGGNTKRMDVALVKKYFDEHGEFPWHFWRAQRWDWENSREVGEPVPLLDVIKEVGDSLAQRTTNFSGAMDMHRKFLEKLTTSSVPDSTVSLQGWKSMAAGALTGGAFVRLQDRNATRERLRTVAKAVDWADLLPVRDRFEDFMRTRAETDFVKAKASVLSALEEEARDAQQFYRNYLKISTGLLLAAGGVAMGLKIIGAMMPKEVDAQTGKAGEPVQLARPKGKKQQTVLMQSAAFPDKVANNTYKLTIINKDTVVNVGHCLFVRECQAVMNYHFRATIEEALRRGNVSITDTFRLEQLTTSSDARVQLDLDVGTFLSCPFERDPSTDVMVVRFEHRARKGRPAMFRNHVDITKNFINEGDIQSICGKPVSLNIYERTSAGPMNRRVNLYSSCSYTDKAYPTKFDSVRLKRLFRYVNAGTDYGDCGAPLCITDARHYSGRSIMGFHAGVLPSGEGVSVCLTQDIVRDLCKAFDHCMVNDKSLEDFAAHVKDVTGSATLHTFDAEAPWPLGQDAMGFTAIGSVPREIAANISPNSKLKLTQVGIDQPFGDPKLKPARLRGFMNGSTRVEPMLRAVGRYQLPLRVNVRPMLDRSMSIAMSKLNASTADCTRKTLSFEEAVLGTPGFKSMPRKTSAGYPYTLRKQKGKMEIFGSGEDYDLETPEAQKLKARVGRVVAEAKNNTRLCHIFTDALKDELRAESKVENGETRLLSCAPVDLTIATRMYFGSFMNAFMHAPIHTGFTPGMNPFTEWGELYHQLSSKSEDVFDGDFKALDATECRDVLLLIRDAIEDWYRLGENWSEEDATVRRILFMELTDSKHIGGPGLMQNFLYEWHQSMPSGHPLTTVVNSIYCMLVIVHTYVRRAKAAGLDPAHFHDYVYAAVYGDDHVVNAEPVAQPVLNQVTIAETAKDDFSGMVYTAGDKASDLTTSYTKLEAIRFLQRGFNSEEPFLCPASYKSFLYMNYYCANSKIEHIILRNNWERFLLELSMHTNAVWLEFAPVAFEYYRRSCARFPSSERESLLLVQSMDQAQWRAIVLTMDSPY
jgi:hypothetical protein